MSQTFILGIATDTIASDAQLLGVSLDELKRICVLVSADIVRQPALHLQLTYQVTLPTPSLAAKLNWLTWKPQQVGFSDYLWEETCLECFITGDLIKGEASHANTTDAYIEINASPDGRYALYQFESYRNPATLPPTPLYDVDGYTRMGIDWADEAMQQRPTVNTSLYNTSSPASPFQSHERRFRLPLTQLPNQQFAFNNTVIKYIHPCVILKFNETVLYFAPNHASPPDFHNCHYWSRACLKFNQ